MYAPFEHVSRNKVQEHTPQNSRNDRKVSPTNANMNMNVNMGMGYGTYMPYQTEVKEKPSMRVDGSYAKQFEIDQEFQKHFQQDIRKGVNSAPNEPINLHKEESSNYMFQHNMHYQYDMNRNLGLGIPGNSNIHFDRNGEMGQRRRCAGVVQSTSSNPSYFFQNFETFNKISEKEEEINRFMDRNPVNTRRDQVEKERLQDKKGFMTNQKTQVAEHFHQLTPENTRNDSKSNIQNTYIPNGKTMPQRFF